MVYAFVRTGGVGWSDFSAHSLGLGTSINIVQSAALRGHQGIDRKNNQTLIQLIEICATADEVGLVLFP